MRRGSGRALIDSWDGIQEFVSLGEPVEPDPGLAPMYEDLYAAYRELYPSLSPIVARTSTHDRAVSDLTGSG